MNESKAKVLIERLEMGPEMSIILDVTNDYSRFESAIDECLKKYDENSKVTIKRMHGSHKEGQFKAWEGIKDIDLCIEDFKQYFGVRYQEQTYKQVGLGDSRTIERVRQRVDTIVQLLKSRHKSDIWYNSI